MKMKHAQRPLTAAAARLLKALRAADAAGLVLSQDGGCSCGKFHAPPALVRDLIGRDWVQQQADRLRISSPGLRALERHDAPESGFAAQNRILQSCKQRVPGKTVTVNLAESPLGWLRRRDLIDARQWQAGERLRADYYLGQAPARVTMAWDAPPIGRTARGPAEHLDPTLAQINAKQRFGGAMSAAGPGLSDVLWRVVCAGEGLETAEKALGWPARAGKVVLTLGLDRVAHYYRL